MKFTTSQTAVTLQYGLIMVVDNSFKEKFKWELNNGLTQPVTKKMGSMEQSLESPLEEVF